MTLAAGCIVNYWMRSWVRNYAYQTRDIRNGIMKKIDYLALKVAKDFRFGKEIRLYNFKDYLLLLVQKLLGDFKTERKKVERKLDIEAFSNFLVIGIRDSFAYGLLITKAVHGEIDAAQFVLYFSAITAISEFMAKTLELWAGVSEGALQVSDFRESLEIKGRMNHGTGISLPKAPFSIEFKNVTYRYPKGDKKILDHVSFFIKPGEKVALVGMNGTGKTTMTWLMCGLLLPDAGEVYVDGHLVNEYNRDELYTLFGMIPQNYNLLPLSIARNIAITTEEEPIDYEKVNRCIEAVGLQERIRSLPKGIETPLNRQVNMDGIELSGGEIQKLLMARLLYRNPLCMILDEPTAALDPIAEDRMYQKYYELVKNTTSIFISHRLASTRFCDRIFFLDEGGIAEEGTHEELLRAGKKYRELYEIQSKYYKEGVDGDEKTGEKNME